MAKQSSVNLDITNNADGFDISGGTTVRKLGITGGDVTIAGSGSATVTFPTTSTTIAGLGITQSFSALQSFSAGISAAGGVTLAGTLQGTTANFTGLVSSSVGFSGPGTNITGVVTSFNNQTGAVTGVTVGGTNVFTALNSFTAGLSASGGMTLAGSFQGSTATFRNGNVTINQSSAFGITASNNNLFNIFDSGYSGIKKYFSKYTTVTNLTNQTISSIDQGGYTDFGIFKINVGINEGSGSATLCSISSFILTRSGSTLNWTETSVFNGVNKASFSFSLNGNIIELKITHTVPKLVTGNTYVTEIEQIQ